MILFDITARARHLADLEVGLTTRWREDLALVDQAADDAAFTVAVSAIPDPTP